MEDLLEKVTAELHLDKSRWQLTKFGDVAIQQKKNIDRDDTNLTRYVKGEHMGTEDIHLREWGELTDEYLGPAFIRKFEEGDVLYGSRRTYLKKVVVAPFEGITSNTTFVIKANEKRLDKRLLPFIMLSEGFTNNSIKNSKGSVNPYINWKDIANYEFLLPPKDQQAQLAELLWAMDEVVEKEREVLENCEALRDFNREKLFTYGISALKDDDVDTQSGNSGVIPVSWHERKFSEIVEITSGQVDPQREEYKNLFQIGSERIEPNTGKITEFKTAQELGITSGNYLFTGEHIIYSKIRPYFKKVAYPKITGLCSADIYPLLPDRKIISQEFLFYYLLTEKFTQNLLQFQNRTGMPKVNRDELGMMYVPIPDHKEQAQIVEVLKQIDISRDSILSKIHSSQSLQKSLINQIF
jgi:type I restriction enzyme S subunit